MRILNITWSALDKFANEGIPQLSHELRGPMGRIAVVGGSKEHCGAPYYAAQAALSTHFFLYVCFCINSFLDLGADLVNVYCAEEAAIPIKCYSPELMVLPIYSDHYSYSSADDFTADTLQQRAQSAAEVIIQNMDRIHVLVIGPGLGISRIFSKSVMIMISS